MTAEKFSKAYSSLSCDQQISFLARLAASLTVHARGTYVPGTEDLAEPSRMREFNEFQHRVAFHLVHLLDGNRKRYPDDVFSAIIWEYAQAVDAGQVLAEAMEHAEGGSTAKRNPAA